MGHTIPQTLRVSGRIGKQPVSVLVDSGSTHNFIQDWVAKQVGLPLQPAHTFQVLVGNGEELQCTSICQQLSLTLGKHKFLVDLYVLRLSGAEVVLGVQWLKTLGPVLTDYERLTMKFCQNGQMVELCGEPKPQLEEASLHQLQRMVTTQAIDTCLHLHLITPDPPQDSPEITLPQINDLISQFSTIFQIPTHLQPTRATDHQIPLQNNANPINVRPYRYPQFQKQKIETQIRDMLSQGIIRPSSSSFSSPVLLVRKKDGTWRFCVDYRALNAITLKDRFPIPEIDELLDELYGTQYFSKLDLCSGYHQICMHPDDIAKTAFRTHQGHFEFLVMPFGLFNAPSTFQETMNHLFQPYLRDFVIVFFDDILVFSRSLQEHEQHLRIVFQLLLDNHFFLKMSKCSFAQSSISYLGHVVSAHGVGPNSEKIASMLNWPQPKSLKQLRGFLGLTGFYRKFVSHYASIAAPLTALLKKDSFTWSEDAQIAFERLKQAMIEAPVLKLPNFNEDFVVETDASGIGMGAVLCQQGHPICYFSKKLCPRMQTALTYVRELYAITSAVKKWRAYLLGRQFVIHTDQRSLRELMTQVVQTPEQQFYLAKLLGYSYEIVYKPGAQNKVADVLSRIHDTLAQCLGFTVPHCVFVDKVRAECARDSDYQQLLQRVRDDPLQHAKFQVVRDLLYFSGKLYIPAQSHLKLVLLEEFHASPIGGHNSITKTLSRLKENVYWDGMKTDVVSFVKACIICQSTKHPNHLPFGLLQPLPIPENVWEDVSLDFVIGLPSFQIHTVVLVVVDRLSKAAHFGMLPTHFTAVKVAELFSKMVCCVHGMPKSMVFDRDLIFLSNFWQEVFRLSGTKLRMSSAYHPQSDGQTEIVNKTLQQYLRCFVHQQPQN